MWLVRSAIQYHYVLLKMVVHTNFLCKILNICTNSVALFDIHWFCKRGSISCIQQQPVPMNSWTVLKASLCFLLSAQILLELLLATEGSGRLQESSGRRFSLAREEKRRCDRAGDGGRGGVMGLGLREVAWPDAVLTRARCLRARSAH